MNEIQIMTTITVKENGDILTDIMQKTYTVKENGDILTDIMQKTYTAKENGDILTDIMKKTYIPDDDNNAAADVLFKGKKEVEESETEREAIVSDLANVCEYLEESEVIKIRLIVNKAQMRKERIERESED